MKDGYQSLIVWQKSMALVKEVYGVAHKLPDEERYALSDQMRRASVSIPSNIAEGSRRGTKKEGSHFISIAHGSLAELETQLLLVRELYPVISVDSALSLCGEVGKMLHSFNKSLRELL